MSRRRRDRREAKDLDAAVDRAMSRRSFGAGKLYLCGLFLIGVLSAAAGLNWLRTGELVFRSSEPSASDDPDMTSSPASIGATPFSCRSRSAG